ncbi:hypothetical protein JCM33774_01520 [Actinophytocola sp. KF-1]
MEWKFGNASGGITFLMMLGEMADSTGFGVAKARFGAFHSVTATGWLEDGSRTVAGKGAGPYR